MAGVSVVGPGGIGSSSHGPRAGERVDPVLAPEHPDPIRAQIVDVALLSPAGREAAPRLLTVTPDTSIAGRTHLTVLERSAGRWTVKASHVDEPPVLGATATPWLVGLAPDRFALIGVAPEFRETWIRTVTWSGDRLVLGQRRAVALLVDDAGPADVDGDGSPELVVAEARGTAGGPTCEGSRLAILDLATMGVVAEHRVPEVRLAAGVVADVDAVPGDELVSTAFRDCPAVPGLPVRMALSVVSLAHGVSLLNRRLDAADPLSGWSGRPLAIDGHGGQPATVLVGGPDGLLAIGGAAREARGRHSRADVPTTVITELAGVLLGAAETAQGAVVVTGGADGITTGELVPSPDGLTGRVRNRLTPAMIDDAAREAVVTDVRIAALRFHGGAAWIDPGNGCPALVVPLVVVSCVGDRDPGPAVAARGPAWFATRPLARIPAAEGDRLLVATADAWPAVPARFGAPAPLAAEPAGTRWRHGPSTPFSLAEVAAAGLDQPGAAQPVIGPAALGEPRQMELRAAPGSRALVGIARGAEPVLDDVGLGDLLAGPGPRAAATTLVRLEDAATEGGFAAQRIRLPLPKRPSEPDTTWQAVAVAIGALGDVSPPVRARVVVDGVPPTITLDAPFLSPPWPLVTSVSGRVEPGAAITVGGAPLDVAADGGFELAARLTPWPQRFELRAVDPAGNRSVVRVDLVGGVDYRQLPWAALLVGGLLLGAAWGGLRSLVQPGPRSSRAPAGDVPAPEIEEIDGPSAVGRRPGDGTS